MYDNAPKSATEATRLDEELIQRVRDEQERTLGLLTMLEGRINRVLAPPQDGDKPGSDRLGYSSALLNDINGLGFSQQLLNERLNALIERITL